MATIAPAPVIPATGRGEHLRDLGDRILAWDRDHQAWSDAMGAAALFVLCSVWPPHVGTHRPLNVLFQLALVVPLVWRRRAPSTVFVVVAAVALVQWLVIGPLSADVALLIALFTVAALQPIRRALVAAGILEVGVIMASIRWVPAGDTSRSVLFLTGMVIAALFIGVTLRTWQAYLASLVERARRLEFERDQEVQIAAAAERARIAREMHDIVAHNVSIMVTLADGAAAVGATDPERATEVMGEVSATGRLALADMRRLLGVLRSKDGGVDRTPQPDLAGIPELVERVRSTGLRITMVEEGRPFDVPAAIGLTVYRIAQESLTNVVKHADAPSAVDVAIAFDAPYVELVVRDDGKAASRGAAGHGVSGMRERAAVFGGELAAGPRPGGGWEVAARIRVDGGGIPA